MVKAGIKNRQTRNRQTGTLGFSLIELMVTMVILLAVTGVVMSAMMEMMKTEGTVANRTEMHSSVRSATEVLQQEIGQAGRIAQFTTPVTLTTAIAAAGTATPTLSSTSGIFVNEQLLIDSGAYGTASTHNPETVTVTALNTSTNQITAVFSFTHTIGSPVSIVGAFPSGIIPTNATYPSTASVLKMYGDINADGNMVYVEYNCDTVAGTLTRSVTLLTASTKTASQVILPNILANPGNAACFQYQQKTIGTDTYVVDVSVTLTVQTQNVDPQTNVKQTETKALLNVSPRNVFDAWLLASNSVANRLQPMPASVVTLSQ